MESDTRRLVFVLHSLRANLPMTRVNGYAGTLFDSLPPQPNAHPYTFKGLLFCQRPRTLQR
jgi:hypothetical protein